VAEPPRDSFGSESFTGDYDLNPLFDAPAKTGSINNNQSAMLFAGGLLRESSIRELKRRLRVVWHSMGQTTGLWLSHTQMSQRHRGSPISADSSLHLASTRQSRFQHCRK
jgi:hypothetical protein